MAFKLVISDPKSGRSIQKEATPESDKELTGMKIGDSVNGDLVELPGYDLQITGGSDYCGFPMRKDVQGARRKRILSYQGVGVRKARKGMLQRKTVCGNTVYEKIAQINLKVLKHGSKNVFEVKEGKEAGSKTTKKPEEGKKADAEKARSKEKAGVKEGKEAGSKTTKKPEEGKKADAEKARSKEKAGVKEGKEAGSKTTKKPEEGKKVDAGKTPSGEKAKE